MGCQKYWGVDPRRIVPEPISTQCRTRGYSREAESEKNAESKSERLAIFQLQDQRENLEERRVNQARVNEEEGTRVVAGCAWAPVRQNWDGCRILAWLKFGAIAWISRRGFREPQWHGRDPIKTPCTTTDGVKQTVIEQREERRQHGARPTWGKSTA
ncbi:hypothetical protein DFH06DRAFT_1305277 [Mycena polygramma]|nr:hypothetical protein DFH06DRAFT_1305277 [Mycena polygramma]